MNSSVKFQVPKEMAIDAMCEIAENVNADIDLRLSFCMVGSRFILNLIDDSLISADDATVNSALDELPAVLSKLKSIFYRMHDDTNLSSMVD
jgi:hypothetical protein